MGTQMLTEEVQALHNCRLQLLDCVAEPIDIEPYRDDISCELGVADSMLKELQETKTRESQLSNEQGIISRLVLANNTKELVILQANIKELSAQINRAIRNHSVVVGNKKRVSTELEKLDSILHLAQMELSESSESDEYTSTSSPSLKSETEGFIPLENKRELALDKLRETTQSLDRVKQTLKQEKADHRDLVYDLKTTIKTTQADIQAIDDGTYSPSVEFQSRLDEKRVAYLKELNGKRKLIEQEIEDIRTHITNNTKIHEANMSDLQSEKQDLEHEPANKLIANNFASSELESTFTKLKGEQAANHDILSQLEVRLTNEKERDRLLQLEDEIRIQKLKDMKAREEEEYFAALWIKLRWKAYIKRKAMKDSKKKGKKGGKKKGKK